MTIKETNLSGPGGIASRKAESSGSTRKAKAESVGSTPRQGDQVEVSDAREQLGTLKAHLDQIPDVRMGMVEALKEEVDSGRYHRDAADIAQAIIQEAGKYSRLG